MIKQKILPNQYICQKQGTIESDMDGERVLLSVQNSKYYNLGTVGGVIWDQIRKPISLQSLVHAMHEKFSIQESECKADVTAFLVELLEEGLIHIEKR